MLRFYETLLRRWLKELRLFVTPIRFWFWALGVLGAAFLPSYLLALTWALWLVPAAIMGAGFYTLLVTNYNIHDEVRRELEALNTAHAAAKTEAQRAKEHLLEGLRFYQARGIELRSEMAKTFVPERHNPARTVNL